MHPARPAGQLELAAITRPARDKKPLDVAPHRLSWMSLLARVFRIDVSVCLRCQGPMRVLRALHPVLHATDVEHRDDVRVAHPTQGTRLAE